MFTNVFCMISWSLTHCQNRTNKQQTAPFEPLCSHCLPCLGSLCVLAEIPWNIASLMRVVSAASKNRLMFSSSDSELDIFSNIYGDFGDFLSLFFLNCEHATCAPVNQNKRMTTDD